jgi:hypothetical protein
MEIEEINEIYDDLNKIQVPLAEDPRVMGPGYISRVISQCRAAEEVVNAYLTKAQRHHTEISQQLSLKILERKVRLRDKVTSPVIAAMEVSASERQANAELQIESEYQTEVRTAYQKEGQEAPAYVPSMEAEILEMENRVLGLKTLIDVLKEKKASLGKTDSAVRLQANIMDSELRLFGGIPTQQNRRTPRQVQNTTADNIWNGLMGQPPAVNQDNNQNNTTEIPGPSPG